MKVSSKIPSIVGAAIGLLAMPAQATNTSSVFSPDVKAGEKALEYRFSFVPDDRGDAFAHRLHYQHAFSESFRLRLIALTADPGIGGWEYRYSRLEAQWQFLEDEEAGWDSALRGELQIADGDDLPSRVRLAWTGKWNLDSGWEFRANFLTGHQFGPGSNDGFLLEARAQVTYPILDRWRLGIEAYNDFNNTEAIGSFNDQEHQVGPILKGKIGENWSVATSLLFGVTGETDDADFRVHLIRKF